MDISRAATEDSRAMSDPLAIALEHHRAGRLRQAAVGYRALIDRDPNHAEALHWMGVLALQAGRPAAAVPLLEQAATLRPGDAAFAHNLATAHLQAGQYDEAVRAFERTIKLVPDRAETLVAWGLAHLARRGAGDAQAAAFALRQARAAGMDSAELHRYLGLALLASDQPRDAVQAFATAAERNAFDPGAWHALALAQRAAGEDKEVRKSLNKALEIDPNNPRAWHALARVDLDAGNAQIAAGHLKKATRFDPGFAQAWQDLGRVHQQLHQHAEALGAFKQAVRAGRNKRPGGPRPFDTLSPADLEAAERRLTDERLIEKHHALAANAAIFSPTEVPRDAITNLFDKYAQTFDQHLRGALRYGVPELLAEAVAAARDPDDEALVDILDLGCGTGLIGPLLRPIAATLAGVDLSPAMIEKSRERGCYDLLHAGDMLAALRQSPGSFDLLVAADSLLYTGDLSPIFEAAHGALRPGGVFAFTVEAGAGDRYHLHQKTLRYTHSRPYMEHLGKIHGYETVTFETVTLRHEAERPVAGFLIVLRKPPAV
jgi:predicted TPR repeat methyltransferase